MKHYYTANEYKELWRDIPGYEGEYQASNLGRIKGIHPGTRWGTHILTPVATGKRGDYHVTLRKDNKSRGFLVPRLIAMTWIGMPPKNYTVNHKNGDITDNRAENLEWLTRADNIRHGFKMGLYSTEKPIILQAEDGEVRKFKSQSEASRQFGRSNSYFATAKRASLRAHGLGKTWRIISI